MLVQNLYDNGLIKSKRVMGAMLAIDRKHYVLDAAHAYEDSPQRLGYEATISAPHMHANACESLLQFLTPSSRVLDIGSGSGYLTAVLAELVFGDEQGEVNGGVAGVQGKVVGLEHIKALRDMGETNMRKSERGRTLLDEGKVKFVQGDGRKGWVEQGENEKELWDAIHVGAAATEMHEPLVDQLKRPGRMFIPVEHPNGLGQHIWVVDKDEKGQVTKNMLYGVRYVPLTDAPPN